MHVTIDLLDNFMKLLKAFAGCGKLFPEIAMTENEGGQERKINRRPATEIRREMGGKT
jgi:hypothetical protein